LATLEYLDWFNHPRLQGACNELPPAEFEAIHYRHQQAAIIAAGSKSLHQNPARFNMARMRSCRGQGGCVDLSARGAGRTLTASA